MDTTTVFIGLLLQRLQIVTIIHLVVKTGVAVVTALDDVPGNTGYGQSGASWHLQEILVLDVKNNVMVGSG